MPNDLIVNDIPVQPPIPVQDPQDFIFAQHLRDNYQGPAKPDVPVEDSYTQQALEGSFAGTMNTLEAAFGWALPESRYKTVPFVDEQGNFKALPADNYAAQLGEAKTISGSLIRGGSEFAPGLLAAGSIVKSTSLAQSMIKGALADYAAFGPTEERLSNALSNASIPVVSAAANYLKAEEDDGQLLGRLKNVVEGGILGVAVDGLFRGLSKVKRGVKEQDKGLIREGTQDVEEALAPAEIKPTEKIKEALARPATAKDRLIAEKVKLDPKLSYDEAEALADIEVSVAKYINPAQEADVTLKSIRDVVMASDKDAAIVNLADALKKQGLSENKALAEASRRLAKVEGANGITSRMVTGKALVQLFEGKANLSTHVHELAHTIQPYIRPEDKAVFDSWLGSTGKWTRAAEEKFAKGFEAYLKEGKAPTEGLKGAFERIRGVMTSIYATIRGKGSRLVRLNDDVRAAYDRLLSSAQKEAIHDTRVVQVAKQLADDLQLPVKPIHVRYLDEALRNGGKINPDALTIPHFTRILRAAHDAQGTTQIAESVFKSLDNMHPTGVMHLTDISRMAQEWGKDAEAIKSHVSNLVADQKQLPAALAALDWHTQTLVKEVHDLAAKIDAYQNLDEIPEELGMRFMQRQSEMHSIVNLQIDAQTLIGRSMNAYRLRGGGIDAVAKLFDEGDKQVKDLLQSSDSGVLSGAIGGKGNLKKAAQAALAAKTAKDIAEAGSKWNAAFERVMTYYMAQILSGPSTQMVSVLSGTLMSLVHPLSRMVGATAVGNLAEARKAWLHIVGMKASFMEAYRAMGPAFKSGQGFLGNTPSLDKQRFHSLEAIKSDDGLVKRGKHLAFLSFRLLQTQDTFFKVLNYRASLYADFLDEASKQANPDAWLKANIDKLQSNAVGLAGEAKQKIKRGLPVTADEGKALSAFNKAKAVVFDQDLKPGTASAKINELVNAVPLMRIVVPFVKIPSNVIKEMGKHVPIVPVLHGTFRRELMGKLGAQAQAAAIGKQIVGSTLAVSAIGLYKSGHLTGSGPRDPEERKLWFAQGNQEYSIKVGDRWISYKRLDPFSSLLSIFADIGKATDKVAEAPFSIILNGILAGTTDKTYLKGITDLSQALADAKSGGDRAELWASNVTSGFIPGSSAMSQASRAYTGVAYKMHGFLDAFKARSFGLWEPEKRFDVYGNPVEPGIDNILTPFATTAVNPSPAMAELAQMKGGLDLDAPDKVGTVALTQQEKEFIAKEQFTVKVNGKTFMEAMESLVQSQAYRNAPAHELTPEGYKAMSQRTIMTRREWQMRRDEAMRKAQVEFPRLKIAIQQDRNNKMYAKSGDFSRIMEITGR